MGAGGRCATVRWSAECFPLSVKVPTRYTPGAKSCCDRPANGGRSLRRRSARPELATSLCCVSEAARDLARGQAFATMLATEEPDPDGDLDAVAAALDDAAPHLDEREPGALQVSYLGKLTWATVCETIGVRYDGLRETFEVPAGTSTSAPVTEGA